MTPGLLYQALFVKADKQIDQWLGRLEATKGQGRLIVSSYVLPKYRT